MRLFYGGYGGIAAEIQRNRSTISRALKRNAGPTGYKPAATHKQARTRQCGITGALQVLDVISVTNKS